MTINQRDTYRQLSLFIMAKFDYYMQKFDCSVYQLGVI